MSVQAGLFDDVEQAQRDRALDECERSIQTSLHRARGAYLLLAQIAEDHFYRKARGKRARKVAHERFRAYLAERWGLDANETERLIGAAQEGSQAFSRVYGQANCPL